MSTWRMSTRLSALLLSKPALSLTCPAAISSSQETYIPLLVLRCFSSPPEKTDKGTFDEEMMEMFNKLMESVRHFSSLPANAKPGKNDSIDVEMRKIYEEWVAKYRRFYDSEEEKERRFNLFKETIEENVLHFSSLIKSNEVDSVDVEMRKMFEEWMIEYARLYSSPEEKGRRFETFKKNVRKINAHNKVDGRTYDQGVNQFADWTNKEFKNHEYIQ